jgi:hypothetical protein
VCLALLCLTLHEENDFGARAWKGHDWDALNRLHERGLIDAPKTKAKKIEGPQLCHRMKPVQPQVIRGEDFVAVKTTYR